MKKILKQFNLILILTGIIISTLCFSNITNAQSQSTPLPNNEAFVFSFHHIDANNLRAQWKIHSGYHLYRSSISFKIADNNNAQLGTILKPSGESEMDETLGKYEVYRNNIAINIPVLGLRAGNTDLRVHYQGCSDTGFCYPPQTTLLSLHFDPELKLNVVTLSNEATSNAEKNSTLKNISTKATQPSEGKIGRAENLLASHNTPLIIIGFFIFGLLLSFTPCVLPMIPIISSIILGHGENITTRKSFMLSLTYVLAMSLTYAVMGMFISTLGENLQSLLQQPWILIISSALFFLLALSMFGLYEIKMPQRFEARLANISHHQRAGHYVGVAVMGILATLILSPCVTAPLVGVLAYIAMSGDLYLGFTALFFLGFGMGAPLLLIGLSAGKLLPKAGFWMNSIKIFFGLLLIAVSINLLNRLLPGSIGLMLWSALTIVTAFFIFSSCNNKDTSPARLAQGFSIFIALYGLIMLVGGAAGNDNPRQPLQNLKAHSTTTQNNLSYIHVKTTDDMNNVLQRARREHKKVMLDFYADWCLSCKIIERTTLRNTDVKKALSYMLLAKADITKNDSNDNALKKMYGVIAPPTFIFFDDNGNHLNQFDIVGEISAAEMLRNLQSQSEK